jgi:uncharacterized protein (TIGR00251 family)
VTDRPAAPSLDLVVRSHQGGVKLNVRVIPRASRNAVEGIRDGRLVVKVTAPPVDAAANDAVIALLAGTLGVPKRQLAIATGASSRSKTIQIAGTAAETIRARLSDILA